MNDHLANLTRDCYYSPRFPLPRFPVPGRFVLNRTILADFAAAAAAVAKLVALYLPANLKAMRPPGRSLSAQYLSPFFFDEKNKRVKRQDSEDIARCRWGGLRAGEGAEGATRDDRGTDGAQSRPFGTADPFADMRGSSSEVSGDTCTTQWLL